MSCVVNVSVAAEQSRTPLERQRRLEGRGRGTLSSVLAIKGGLRKAGVGKKCGEAHYGECTVSFQGTVPANPLPIF